MHVIQLDAREWQEVNDFYSALLPALGAPDWHGRNLDALWDSVRGDDINSARAPLRIEISGVEAIPTELRDWLGTVRALFAEAEADGIPVAMHFDAS